MPQKRTAKKSVKKKGGLLPNFNFRRLAGGKVIISGDSGASLMLKGADFQAFKSGRLGTKSPLYTELAAKGFVRDRMDLEGCAAAQGKLNSFLGTGPGLHILVLTLRCNHKCLYCQSSAVGAASGRGTDMTRDVARKSVDFALKSTNPSITIEFQGGEPLLNWDTLKDAVLYARRRGREQGREVRLALVSNFSLMTREKAEFLLANEVSICTSLDGPADLHNKIRVFSGGNSHAMTLKWLKFFSDRESRQGPGYRVFKPSALLTVSRESLGRGKDIIDEYLRLGLEDIFLRPLAPIGFARKLWGTIGYSAAEFLDFYRAGLEYAVKLNLKGKKIRERNAVMMLQKILNGTDPGYLDMRCPCGAGIGQIAYNYNGDLYTCDEGRMVGWEGDELFKIGNVKRDSYSSAMLAPATKACAAASSLDAQPQCARCAYRPYCGVCPVFNYEVQGSLYGDMFSSSRCELSMGMLDTVFSLLDKPASAGVFKEWVSK